jgi:galactokinase
MTTHLTDRPMSYFHDRFGRLPKVTATAPGRLALLGEHTEDPGGLALSLALPHHTTVELSPGHDDLIVVTSLRGDAQADTYRYRTAEERRQGTWADYVQGVTHVLRKAGQRIHGFQALISSSIPSGSGFASSTALVVSLLRALRQGFGLDLDDVTIAKLGQQAEQAFAGAPMGVQDPLAVSLGRPDAVLYADSRDLACHHVALPGSVDVIVLHAGVVARHAAVHFAARHQDVEQAAAALGVAQLRELGPDDLPRLAPLPEALARRARHVITENDRVQAAAKALAQGNLASVGRLLHESQRSLRDDYQITGPEIDLLADLLRFEPAVYGARLTGGGPGIMALVESGRGGVVAKKIARRYAEQSGRQPTIVLPQ